MWEIYDDLINEIPKELVITDMVAGAGWTAVKTDISCGVAGYQEFDTRSFESGIKKFQGAKLCDVAECIKSWNLMEASIGQAAMNAWYNSISCAKENEIEINNYGHMSNRLNDPFIQYQNAVKGKTVLVIGHFHFLEQLIKPVCKELRVINYYGVKGDYPESALEYLLQDADYIIMTPIVLLDKRLPIILSLSKNSYKIMVSPGTPLSPVLIKHGIHDLSGFVITDLEEGFQAAAGNVTNSIYSTGCKVSLKAGR